jgi:hypothetical protein
MVGMKVRDGKGLGENNAKRVDANDVSMSCLAGVTWWTSPRGEAS